MKFTYQIKGDLVIICKEDRGSRIYMSIPYDNLHLLETLLEEIKK
jgi:hypothetical protein